VGRMVWLPITSSTLPKKLDAHQISIWHSGDEAPARPAVGGTRADDTGWYVEPTVFADDDNSSAIAREEIAPCRHFDDAISLATGTQGFERTGPGFFQLVEHGAGQIGVQRGGAERGVSDRQTIRPMPSTCRGRLGGTRPAVGGGEDR
jgi:hypothetical protein